jgi:serine/threonine-protein kinase
MAFILASTTWDVRGGARASERALALAPGDADVVRSASLFKLVRGRFDGALALSRRSVELDPLNQACLVGLGKTLLYMERHAEAEAAFRKALEQNPQSRAARGWLCWMLCKQRRLDEAEALAQAIEEPDWRALCLTYVRWDQGRREESDRLLADITTGNSGVFAYQIAEAHAYRGEIDAAFEWLERAYAQHDPGLHYTLVDPSLAPLRKDLRWPGLMSRRGLAD